MNFYADQHFRVKFPTVDKTNYSHENVTYSKCTGQELRKALEIQIHRPDFQHLNIYYTFAFRINIGTPTFTTCVLYLFFSIWS